MGIDHVNPKSWKGKVKVGDVNLKEQWTREEKEQRLLQKFYGHPFNFETKFQNSNCDLLRPTGSYVGVSATTDDAHSEEERETPLHPQSVLESQQAQPINVEQQPEDDSNSDRAGYDSQDLNFDDPIENFEDFLPDTPQEIDEDALPKTFSKWLDYDGKKILKTSFVSTLSTVYSKKLTV